MYTKLEVAASLKYTMKIGQENLDIKFNMKIGLLGH